MSYGFASFPFIMQVVSGGKWSFLTLLYFLCLHRYPALPFLHCHSCCSHVAESAASLTRGNPVYESQVSNHTHIRTYAYKNAHTQTTEHSPTQQSNNAKHERRGFFKQFHATFSADETPGSKHLELYDIYVA